MVGAGFNVVYAETLSEAAILRAVGRGHLYLSAGPQVEFSARTPTGDRALMGDALPAGVVEFTVGWAECPEDAWLRLMADGRPLAEWRPGDNGTRAWSLSAGQARWCLVELRDAQGRMLALTNPIFIGSTPM
jgi:hypothetical protein